MMKSIQIDIIMQIKKKTLSFSGGKTKRQKLLKREFSAREKREEREREREINFKNQ